MVDGTASCSSAVAVKTVKDDMVVLQALLCEAG